MTDSTLIFLTSGAPIIAWFATFLFVGKNDAVWTVSWFAFWLALICNHPHFLGSYILLYSDFKKDIVKKFRNFWAAVVVPVFMIAYFTYALRTESLRLIGYAINTMFFLVGWHYVKQIFGCVIVGAARQGQFYNRSERWTLLLNLFCLWWVSMLRDPYGSSLAEYQGVTYDAPATDQLTVALALGCLALSLVMLVIAHVQRYIRTGHPPTKMGLMAMLTIYLWYGPGLGHPVYGYMIPFFHSLQYLALAGLFKFNKTEAAVMAYKGEEQRRQWLKKFGGFCLGSFVLGLIGFNVIPYTLDSMGLLSPGHSLGPTPFTACVLVFINVHHYFIDNVIWRASNTEVRTYLFRSAELENWGDRRPPQLI